jgi:hypothetical protein
MMETANQNAFHTAEKPLFHRVTEQTNEAEKRLMHVLVGWFVGWFDRAQLHNKMFSSV